MLFGVFDPHINLTPFFQKTAMKQYTIWLNKDYNGINYIPCDSFTAIGKTDLNLIYTVDGVEFGIPFANTTAIIKNVIPFAGSGFGQGGGGQINP